MTGEEPQESTEETTDVGELIQNERVRSITDARRQVIDVVTKAQERYTLGQVPEELKNTQIAQAVDVYVRELGYLLRHSEVGQKYWTKKRIGVWEPEPPDIHELAWGHKLRNDIGSTNMENSTEDMPRDYTLRNEEDYSSEPVVVEGLKGFLEIPIQREINHTASFHITYWSKNHGLAEVTENVVRVIPSEISMNAFEVANDFAGRMGLDIELQEDKGPASI